MKTVVLIGAIWTDPVYKLKNAGLHGNGISAVQDVGLDPGENRTFETDQDPHGVSGQPKNHGL